MGGSFAALKFEVPTQQKKLLQILQKHCGPASADYFAAAQFLFQSNGDNVKKALE
jgi:hypothetical protein